MRPIGSDESPRAIDHSSGTCQHTQSSPTHKLYFSTVLIVCSVAFAQTSKRPYPYLLVHMLHTRPNNLFIQHNCQTFIASFAIGYQQIFISCICNWKIPNVIQYLNACANIRIPEKCGRWHLSTSFNVYSHIFLHRLPTLANAIHWRTHVKMQWNEQIEISIRMLEIGPAKHEWPCGHHNGVCTTHIMTKQIRGEHESGILNYRRKKTNENCIP